MNILNALGSVLGTGYSSGLNLYATILTLGLLQRYGFIHLAKSLEILSHPLILGIAAVLYFVEFFADKVPYIDTVWDAIHTFIRRPLPRCSLMRRSAAFRRNGAGPQHCLLAVSRSPLIARKPLRAQP